MSSVGDLPLHDAIFVIVVPSMPCSLVSDICLDKSAIFQRIQKRKYIEVISIGADGGGGLNPDLSMAIEKNEVLNIFKCNMSKGILINEEGTNFFKKMVFNKRLINLS